jgi:hypothetical protein
MSYTIPLVGFSDRQLGRAEDLYKIASKAKDTDLLCELAEYEMYRAALPKNLCGVLHHGVIVLQKKLSVLEEKITIGHEIFHNEFHCVEIAYRMKPKYRLTPEEARCELFGTFLEEPPGFVRLFSSYDQYRASSTLTPILRELRIRANEKYGW